MPRSNKQTDRRDGGRTSGQPTSTAKRGLVGEAAIVLIALAGGTVFRFYYPDPDTLWLDEACTVLTASQSPGGIIQALHEDGNPPLYYFLLHLWIAVFGDGEAGLRVLSGI